MDLGESGDRLMEDLWLDETGRLTRQSEHVRELPGYADALEAWRRLETPLRAQLRERISLPLANIITQASRVQVLVSRMKTFVRESSPALREVLLTRWKSFKVEVVLYRLGQLELLAWIESEDPQLAVKGWISLALLDEAIDMDDAEQLSPIVLYVSNDDAYNDVREALDDAMEAFGLAPVRSSPPIRGSVWQVITAAFKRQVEPDRLDQAGDAFTAGAKARWYGEPQSQITKAQGEAVANLLDKLQSTPDALIMISNILIVKVDGVPVVRELTPEQVQVLQENPSLFTDPRLALSRLQPLRAEVSGRGPDSGQQSIAR
ncbi:hypothetical protein F5972_08325 [Microbispora cellulosiformans]|uniref:Uncharacterized protein n=1 Tax=Microbispora cellulosiformans TaxID=2614688 RepID=A0A5J5K885_9ACTN|nr:hypothetical protein [Microbispora cellulosiformans]KAA9379649.1 hypothetical protein F5972_08325 [Microbispora cellulosiformans]